METKDFKRNSVKTMNPKLIKAGLKDIAAIRVEANLTHEVLATRSAVGHLMRDLQDYIVPGVQLRDAHRTAAKENLGEVLQHAVTVAKILKAKVPSAQKKIKPKHTPTHLLIEIDRVANQMLDTVVAVLASAKYVPMTKEEKEKASLAYGARLARAKEKFDADTSKDKGEFKAPKEPAYVVATTEDLNLDMLKTQVEHLIANIYEFAYTTAVTDPAVESKGVIAEIYEARIKKLTPSFPEHFFDAPPKKPAPPREKKTTPAEAVVPA